MKSFVNGILVSLLLISTPAFAAEPITALVLDKFEVEGQVKVSRLRLPYDHSADSWLIAKAVGLAKWATDQPEGQIDVQVFEPASGAAVVGDVIYLTGHSGRAGDAKDLIAKLVSQNQRVITFSYPEHGDSKGVNLDLTTIKGYGSIVKSLDTYLVSTGSVSRPLTLAGFSTGGLIAIRLMQKVKKFGAFTRRLPSKLLVIAPALAARPDVFLSTSEKLTGDPDADLVEPFFIPATQGDIVASAQQFFKALRQRSPYAAPLFAVRVVTQGIKARWNGTWWLPFSGKGLPPTTQVMIVSNGPNDTYVRSGPIDRWAKQANRQVVEPVVLEKYFKNFHGEFFDSKSEEGADVISSVSSFVSEHPAKANACPALFSASTNQ